MRQLLGMVTLLVAGCGNVDGGMAQQECREFVTVDYCEKVALCDPTTSQADCISIASLVLDCSTVTAVKGNFASCKTDLAAETCPVFWDGTNINQPASCQHIFVR